MSFNLKVTMGATNTQIKQNMNYQSFLVKDSEIVGIRTTEYKEPELISVTFGGITGESQEQSS